ncbi:MAG: retropepsin-like aspartic protease family protein [Nitrososphaerales archaeon]
MPVTTIELKAENSHFVVPIDLTIRNNAGLKISERFEFLLDTGATKCVIPKETARAYDIELMHNAGGEEAAEMVSTANGSIPVSVVRAESMTIADTTLSVKGPIEIWLGNDFLLGMNFLSHFRLRVEYGHKLVIEE